MILILVIVVFLPAVIVGFTTALAIIAGRAITEFEEESENV